MQNIYLRASHARVDAEHLLARLERGDEVEVFDLEVLKELHKLVRNEPNKYQYVRPNAGKRETVYTMVEIDAAIEYDIEVRPPQE